ncbi:MAG TPA: sodium/solute symporter [Bryobacteraceae bacterium]|nr:sodium/solute symporter [Bryobacteraceae bacterium]
MKSLAPLDYFVITAYLFAIAAIGSSFYRRKSTAREYFLGGRAMSWLPVGISIIAADLSAITVMGSPAWAFRHNLELVWTSVGYPLAAPIAILVFVPFYSRLPLYTAYEYLERRFDLKVRLFTSLLFQILRGMHVAVVIYAPALVIHLITGLPGWQCIFLMGGFTTLYTTLGGVKAVIWTDVLQFTAVSVGIVVILVAALASVPGGLPAAWRAAAAAGKLHHLNLSLDPSQLTSLWACVIGGLVLALGPLTTDQAVLQRLFTTKSSRDCRQSILVQAVIVVPLSVVLSLVGTALFAFYHFHPARLAGVPFSDDIVPFFAMRELPAGLSGLVIASLFSASMAVMSAGINSLTTATTIDFYQRLYRPGREATHYGWVGRLGTLAWGAVVTCLALYADRLGELALAYNKVSSVITGPMLGIFLLASLTRRATANGVLAGALAGGIAVAIVSAATDWSFFLFGPVGVAVTLLAGFGASLLQAPPAEQRVRGLVVGYGEPGAA